MGLDFNNCLLVFVRAGAFLAILPMFTMLNVPVQMRVALAALLTVLVAFEAGEPLVVGGHQRLAAGEGVEDREDVGGEIVARDIFFCGHMQDVCPVLHAKIKRELKDA